ncbi:hypothetical protein J2129_002061 [Methanofollis sp. W23]|uniref:hypothetical protein n=1 Tax=Methanofollis sp. W23 TaxID=2817849 RepID=UPI001AE4C9AD|nr:hypothetical protein [Methanofollis sp. W23]MBP2146607.1 hypothetical protein [Methanofollis sp. W23]
MHRPAVKRGRFPHHIYCSLLGGGRYGEFWDDLVLNFALYSFRSESKFFFGAFEILAIFLSLFGALIYGDGSGDRAR